MTGVVHAHHGPMGETPQDDPFAHAMAAAMERMMAAMQATPPSGHPDQDFLAMMVPHHEGAIEMARLVLVHGRDPLTRQLAEEILAGQTIEVAAMQARFAALRSPTEEYPTLGGTRGGGPRR
ncbi:DUF305 domain-containing protein [Paeniroseomonas aquatica]|uniref:DUF305 domain-containing protein n=1 Tax=Paeniroseomonas aquatica TaxID=373043 RepID=A0ABT8A4B5_9PROT|nr:DUF305 domain-containing protein [Paeniroseomonas aquatica]MDN3564622.1 DUF305 domain-containing protein [Paeniroseomonas aquatica]